MPTTASATYTGKFVGEEYKGSSQEDISGNVSITANFSAGNVDGRVSDIKGLGNRDKAYDVKMSGKINGNRYSGSADIVNSGTNTNVGTTAYTAHKGSFLGKGASEIAGVVGAENTDGTGVSGAYGAKK